MDEVLEKGIVRCFPEDECLRRIVRREFLKCEDQCEDQQNVDTLAFMAIKSIMHKELMTDEMDIYSQCIYKLIFKEEIGNFWDLRAFLPIFESDQQSVESVGIDNLEAQLQRLRSDGLIMLALLSQPIYRYFYGFVRIIVTRLTLQIRLNGPCIAEIPHRDGLEYDTYWALKFAKMVMSSYIFHVMIEMNGDDLHADQFNSEYMLNFLNKSIIEKLPRVIPSEGWQQYISRERPVYAYCRHDFVNTNYCAHFFREDYYSQTYERYYWGYLGDE